MTLTTPSKITALHHAHLGLGASMVEKDGWLVAERYGSVDAEMEMAAQAGGICDISPMGKLDVQGNNALAGVGEALGLSGPLPVSGTRRVEEGGVAAIGLAHDEALVLTPAGDVASIAEQLEKGLDGCAHLVDVTSAWAAIAVVGPLAHRVLSKVAELDLDPRVFPDGGCVQGKAVEVHVIVLRSDVGKTLGYQVLVTRDYGEYLWEPLLHAGHGEGVGPVGFEALSRLRSG